MIVRRISFLFAGFAVLFLTACADEKTQPTEKQSIEKIAAASERLDGFFTVFRKRSDGSVHMLVREDQLGQEFIHTVVAQDGVVRADIFAVSIATIKCWYCAGILIGLSLWKITLAFILIRPAR